MIKKYLNLRQGLNVGSMVLFILLFFSCNMLHAQVDKGNSTKVNIALKDGAKIFSADDNFNKQILAGKVVLKNYDISYQKNEGQDNVLKLVARQSHKHHGETLQNQLKLAELKRQKEVLRKVKKEIQKFEERIQAFAKLDFNGAPSPDQFFSSNTIAKIYVAPSQNSHDFSKFYTSTDVYTITRALDFLHSQKYTYYNNKSLNFCFSEVFSVRPPPVLA